MVKESVIYRYKDWVDHIQNKQIHYKLVHMHQKEIEDSFFKELSFGTGGIRGIMGIGTAKINEFVVARATEGLARYMKQKKVRDEFRKVVIGYDTRNNSALFAQITANVFMNHGIQTYLFSEALPTPCVSFAVRQLHCYFGIVITASHNPAEYNGYKVYEKSGCQITNKMADDIYSIIKEINYFDVNFTKPIKYYSYVSNSIYRAYIDAVQTQSIYTVKSSSLKIIYSPLNGTGLKPVMNVLNKSGFNNVIVVDEQKKPDGNFPTCQKPNPEEKEAMSLGIEYAKRHNSDIVMATDPDCDRISIAIKNGDDYSILSANELGCLLLDFICLHSDLKSDSVFIKTIVTTDLAEMIAQKYGLKTINTLTGFKYVGEQINYLEKNHAEDRFVFGFEESCGFLKGTYVRDKDATVTAMLICEMITYWSEKNKSLIERLYDIYNEYGYFFNVQHSYKYDGPSGAEKILNIMEKVRYQLQKIASNNIVLKKDYLSGVDGLPPSNVIKLYLDSNTSIVFRPSGTEPKLKIYFSILCKNSRQGKQIYDELLVDIQKELFL